MIYSVRETDSGYFLEDRNKEGSVTKTYLIKLGKNASCSCESFKLLGNPHNHFHIKVVRQWIKDGRSPYSRYSKGEHNTVERLV